MNIMNRVRLYHAFLATLAIAAYLSGEIDPVHAWLGYGVAAVIVLRLLWALGGARQVGLMRFYPHFHGLKLGTVFTHPAISGALLLAIALCLIGVTGTGIALDQGRTFGLGRAEMRQQAQPATPELPIIRGDDDEDGEHRGGGGEDEEGGEAIEEVHEVLGNLLMFLVGGHVAYLLLFKRPLARFMLFLKPARRPEQPGGPKAAE